MPSFHERLSGYIDSFVLDVYKTTKDFPKKEIYGVTSQFRRAALSIPLNYQEGHGRMTEAMRMQFLRISFGSLKECMYLVRFCRAIDYLAPDDHKRLEENANNIYSMLWAILRKTRD